MRQRPVWVTSAVCVELTSRVSVGTDGLGRGRRVRRPRAARHQHCFLSGVFSGRCWEHRKGSPTCSSCVFGRNILGTLSSHTHTHTHTHSSVTLIHLHSFTLRQTDRQTDTHTPQRYPDTHIHTSITLTHPHSFTLTHTHTSVSLTHTPALP